MSRLLRFCFFCFSVSLMAVVGEAQPVANFTATPVTGCYPHVVSFTDMTTGGATSWSWNFGNGSGSALQNPIATYLAPGPYTVTLTATGPNGSNTETKTSFITIYGPPHFSFSGTPSSGCLPLTVNFSANVTAANAPGLLSYIWDFGDGTPNSTEESPAHVYTTAGSYTVNLTVTNGQGCDTSIGLATYVTVYGPPVASFSVNQRNFCTPTPVTAAFINTSTSPSAINSTVWDFGDGTGGTGLTPNHIYNTGGVFTVTMVTKNIHGCRDSVAQPGYVGVYPTQVSFSGPTSVCVNEYNLYTSTTPGITNYRWDFGNNDTSHAAAVNHIYNYVGTFNVTLTSTDGPCTKTLTKAVTVNPRPITTIAYSPDIPCPAPVIVTLTATSTTPNKRYLWSLGDTSTATGNPVPHTYNSNGYKDIWALATDTLTGCSDTAFLNEVPIRGIITHIAPDPPTGAGCTPFSPSFILQLFSTLPPPPAIPPPYPSPAITNNWTFRSGIPGTSTSSNPSSLWTAVGNYWVSVTGMTGNGCSFVDSISIHADTPIVPDFSASPLVVCTHSPVTFTNLSPAGVTEFEWLTSEDTHTGGYASFTYKYRHPGLKNITLVANHLGCKYAVTKLDYIEVSPPDAAFNFTTECPPSYTAHFTDVSLGADSWSWDFGDGSAFATVQNPSHTYASPANYLVRLTTHNSLSGCTDTTTRDVRFRAVTLSVTTTDTAVCAGEALDLAGTYNGILLARGAWIIDNDTVTNYLYTPALHKGFTDTGFHDVRFVTIAASPYGDCFDTLYLPRYILVAKPFLNFSTLPPIGCQPLQMSLVDNTHTVSTTAVVNRVWEYGDYQRDTILSSITTSHTFTALGRDSVTLHITDNIGCEDSLTKYIEVRKPHAAFEPADTLVCIHYNLSFGNQSSGTTALSYLWDFGDGKKDTARNPIHHWDSAGQYTVSLRVTDVTPCADTSIRSRLIRVLAPKAAFTMDKKVSACQPMVVHFTNGSSAATIYSWNLGTGSSPSPVTDPVNTYRAPGIYSITLISSDAHGCADTASDSVFVLGYGGAFTYTPLKACPSQPIRFNAIAGVSEIRWDFGDGHLDTTSVPYVTHAYADSGIYWPKVIFTEGPGCSAGSPGLLPINIDRVWADFGTSTPCAGAPFTLTQNARAKYDSPDYWIWRFSAADSATGSPVAYTFNTPGIHSVRLIASNSRGCKDTIVKNVFVNYLPIVDAGPADTGICPGDLARLIGHGALSYTWSPANLVSCVVCDTTYVGQATPPTWYFVAGTDTNGCVNRDSILARIQIKTTSGVQPGGDICIGETFRLHVSGADVYSWQPEAFLDSPHIASPLATPIVTTNYVVAAQEGTCLIRYDTVTVVVHPTPFFDAGPDELINYGSSVVLHPTKAGISSIQWRQDSTLSCLSCFDPVAHPSYSNIYYARATSEYGCVATDSVIVRVRCNGDSVFIPNTFTPNGDGLNDYFYPRGKGVDHMSSFRIYNRWGELVFEHYTMPLNDEKSGWDGTFKGKQLPPDVYVYTMSTRCESGEPVSWKGDITLIR